MYHSEIETVLQHVKINIKSYQQEIDNTDYVTLPSWSLLQGANMQSVANQLRNAVQYTIELATITNTTTNNLNSGVIRLQPNHEPVDIIMRQAIHVQSGFIVNTRDIGAK